MQRLALPCGGEELAIGRCGSAHTPDLGHRQRPLRRDHVGQRLVDRLAFDVPASETGELPIVVSVGSLCHLTQAQIQALGEQDVEQRSEEHTSELQSLMRISYAVFCLKKKNKITN